MGEVDTRRMNIEERYKEIKKTLIVKFSAKLNHVSLNHIFSDIRCLSSNAYVFFVNSLNIDKPKSKSQVPKSNRKGKVEFGLWAVSKLLWEP